MLKTAGGKGATTAPASSIRTSPRRFRNRWTMSQLSTLVALLSSITILCRDNNKNIKGLWIEASSLAVSTSSSNDDGPMLFSPTLSCTPEEDGSVMCQFRIIESAPDGQMERFDVAFEDCPMGYDYCIQAKVSGKFIRKEEEQSQQQESITNTAENTVVTATTEQQSTRNKPEEQIVRVRLATYRPPWSQYGEHVAHKLATQPVSTFLSTTTTGGSSSSSFLDLDQGTMTWANWYFDVGSAHLLQYQLNPDLDWYEMELALNAYQQVVTTLFPEASSSSSLRGSFLLQALSLSSTSSSSSSSSSSGTTLMLQATFERYLSRDNLLASVYFQMGQSYLMHPDQTQMTEALTSFQMALHIYTELRMAVQSIFAITDAVVTLEIHPHDERTIQLQWASTASTISSILVSVSSMSDATVGPAEQPQVTQQMTLLLDSLSTNLDRIKPQQEQVSSPRDGSLKLQNSLAEKLLENALHIYRRYLTNDTERSTFTMEELAQTQTSFATALQSAAALASVHGRLEDSKTWLLEALHILDEHVLPYFTEGSVELESYIISKADNMLTLAGVWLSLGDYDEAKHYYRKALEFYEQHNVEVSPLSLESSYTLMVDPNSSVEEGMGHDEDDILRSHVEALEEYHARVEGGRGSSRKSRKNSNILDGAGGGAGAGDFYYQRNDRYEAELHGNLGSLYLSRGELERSRGHLEAALGLCGESSDDAAPSDVCSDRQVAEVKLNLAAALFHLRLFSQSIQRHSEALDIYFSMYGPGVNPILQAMEEYALSVDDTIGVGEQQHLQPEGGRGEEEGAGTGGSHSNSGHERFIDIGRFKQTVTNVTAGTSASKHEEEL
jgi:tetratricopeptide (TPR) repeat protein